MKKLRKDHAYWGKRSSIYDAATAYVVGKETQHETARWLSNQFKDTDEVLELGCGTGQFSEVIAGKARHLTAADGALEMLDVAKGRLAAFAHVIVQTKDCYRTTFPDNIFDVVFLGNVIHILGQPMKALTESWRVLKPGGHILVADATSCGMPFWSKIAMGIRYLRKFGKPPGENRIGGRMTWADGIPHHRNAHGSAGYGHRMETILGLRVGFLMSIRSS